MSQRLRYTALLAPVALILAGCGASSSGTGQAQPAAEGTFPVTVEVSNGEVTIPAEPTKIVSLSPSATEMLFAIEADDQVIAADEFSNFPEEAPDEKGLSGFQPNLEAILAKEPDLVVVADDMDGIIGKLTAAKVPTIQLAAATSLEDTYDQIQDLGLATGHTAEAAEVVADTKERIDAAVASVGDKAKGKKVFHEVSNDYYSVTSDTFAGSIYELFGLENIADAAPDAAASGGYPQLNAEFIIKSAPDYIVLADTVGYGVTEEQVAERPGFSDLPALKNDDVLAENDDIVSRWGPRIAEFAEHLAEEINA